MAKTILNDGTKAINKEIQTIAILSSSIAHELKNYLAAIHICAELSEMQLGKIRKKVKTAAYLIGNLQLQIKGVISGKPDTRDFIRYSITKNIKEALEQYPFKENELELITLDIGKDFEYIGNPALTNHILYNFISNALRAIGNAGKGKIVIQLKPEITSNKLIFRDTATGIAKYFLSKMFTLFESESAAQGGTGVGLTFCKLIMQSYGGDISCDSVEEEYTEFVLNFPLIDK